MKDFVVGLLGEEIDRSKEHPVMNVKDSIFARYYAHSAVTMAKGSHPVGVVLVVPPWNFPYAIPMGGVCAALAAGNTVLLKPAAYLLNLSSTPIAALSARLGQSSC